MPSPTKLSNARIGRAGELLVQYELLILGVESAPMTTDSGIDLVAYSAKSNRARTIQVKANLEPKASGGKGKDALNWWFPEDSPADIIALVDLSEKRIWCFEKATALGLAQQKSSGRAHLYMYTDPKTKPKKVAHVHEFETFLLHNNGRALFEA
jgi:hypothetical protein